jgi:BirA family transcriptional regulator, biotin operon repressor / biotin---[acetyl-CoA-carboxylase] ligase
MNFFTPTLETLLGYLASGEYYSGEQLGDFLGVSRTAVWKMVNKLQTLGVNVERIPSRGYRLYHGYQPLNREKILASIGAANQAKLNQIIILSIIDSTNNYLLKQRDLPSGTVCLAEYQTAGRGRRHRQWHAPFGKNILMSRLWDFEQGSSAIVGLSMTIALALVRAFKQYGIDGFHVKWPNDILWQQRKIAGVLIETYIDSVGICHVVMGIGVNVEKRSGEQICNSIDLESIMQALPDRNHLIGLIVEQLLCIIPTFAQTGFGRFQEEWLQYDCLLGKIVNISGLPTQVEGKVVGVDNQGGLMINQGGQVTHFHTGEVSVRECNCSLHY